MLSRPTIVMTIDTKKPRLRFHKSTIHQLGDPKYIQIMINPVSRHIALRGIDQHIPGQHEIPVDRKMANTEDCVDWYCTDLLNQLRLAFPAIKSGNSYSLAGRLLTTERAALFSIDTMTVIEPTLGDSYV